MSRTIAVLLAGLMPLATAGFAPAATLTLGFWGDQLTANNAGDGLNFGGAVDTDGTTAIIGSRLGGNGTGIGSGSAYLFNTVTGDPFQPLTPLVLDPPGGATGDRFGDAVAVSGIYALVGAPNGLGGLGGAYVFNANTGAQIGSPISPGVAADLFGDSLDLAGSLAIIGAPGDDTNGNASGAAYLYNVASLATAPIKLAPVELPAAAQFGYAVAIDGTTAAVTSRFDDGSPLGSGSVYFFDATDGTQVAKTIRDNAVAGDRFGESVALDGNVALVGASRGNGGSGAAYLFDATTGLEQHVLAPSDGAVGFNFGVSVAIEDGLALVGASGATVDGVITGAIYAYDVASGLELAKLVLFDGEQGDNLGISMAYKNGQAIFGSSFDDASGFFRGGAAYLQGILRADVPEPSSAVLAMALIASAAVRTGRNG